jgi:hypothetical protein
VIHFLFFGNLYHILIYGVGDLAFLPIEVLLVSLIVDRLLESNERRSRLNKMNMVVGAFYSEVGTEFIGRVLKLDGNFESVRGSFAVTEGWTDKSFAEAERNTGGFDYHIEAKDDDLVSLRDFLTSKREFLLRLLENPNLLEHDLFSDLLWSVFHLTEELSARKDITALSKEDYAHIAIDIKRAYIAVLVEWLDYMKHLKKTYPYLFAMAVRTNPFDPNAKAELA